MKRKDALVSIRIAGYHNDSSKMIQLYAENRISYDVAKDEFLNGKKMKENGIKCSCIFCNEIIKQESAEVIK